MAPKRKRDIAQSIAIAKPQKRVRVSSNSPHPHGQVDPDIEYKARSILDEKTERKRLYYLVEWEDDPITGQSYDPTWEPEANANNALLFDWTAKKTRQANDRPTIKLKRPAAGSVESVSSTPASTPAKSRRKRRRVIDSSQTSPEILKTAESVLITSSPPQRPQEDSDGEQTSPIEIEESQSEAARFENPSDSDSVAYEQKIRRRSLQPTAAVQLGAPPSSYFAGAYEEFSQGLETRQEELADSSQAIDFARERSPKSEEGAAVHGPSTLTIEEQFLPQDPAVPAKSRSQGSARPRTLSPESQNLDTLKSRFEPTQNSTAAADTRSSVVLGAQQPTVQVPATAVETSRPYPGTDRILIAALLQRPADIGYDATYQTDTEPQLKQREVDHTAATVSSPLVSGRAHPSIETPSRGPRQVTPEDLVQSIESQHFLRASAERREPNLAQTDLTDIRAIATGERAVGLQSVILEPVTPPRSSPRPITADSESESLHITSQSQVYTPPPVTFSQTDSSLPILTQIPFPSARLGPGLLPAAQIREAAGAGLDGASELHGSSHTLKRNPLGQKPEGATQGIHRVISPRALALSHSSSGTPEHRVARSGSRHASTVSPESRRPDMASRTPSPIGGTGSATDNLRANPAKSQHEPTQQSTSFGLPSMEDQQPLSAIPISLSSEIAATLPPVMSPMSTGAMRSPSMVPAFLPDEIATKEDMNTSERYPSLVPREHTQHGTAVVRLSSHREDHAPNAGQDARVAGQDVEFDSTHVVPIVLLGHQRDLYNQEVLYHRDLIDEILGTALPSPDLIARGQDFISRLRNTVVHPDLNNPETATQYADNIRQARWDVDSSAKFRFLEALAKGARASELDLEIVVMARGARTCGMLEVFFDGIRATYGRIDSQTGEVRFISDVPTTGEDTSFVIVDADAGRLYEQGRTPPDIVITLDDRISPQHPVVRSFRKKSEGKWAFLLSLVVPESIEHLGRCIAQTLDDSTRLRTLVQTVARQNTVASRSSFDYAGPQNAANAVVTYLTDGDWSLMELGDLDAVDDIVVGNDVEIMPDVTIGIVDDMATAGDAILKRPLDEIMLDGVEATTKRLRTHGGTPSPPPATINPQDIEITHVSDSVGKKTQSYDLDDSSALAAAAEIHQRQLQELLQGREARLVEIEGALEDLQFRFEEQRQVMLDRTRERDRAVAEKEASADRMQRLNVENAGLRTERALLKAQLEEANTKLLSHAVPERRELEEMRLALDQMRLEADKVQKRADASDRDVEYTRSMYQDSSSAAQELAKANTALLTRVTVLEKLASDEQTRARAVSVDLHTRNVARENAKLKAMLQDREAGLRFKDDEIARLKEAGRGRMGTRASSVPRSPRLGSPLKGGRGSRQTSPTAASGAERGARGHPLRNRFDE